MSSFLRKDYPSTQETCCTSLAHTSWSLTDIPASSYQGNPLMYLPPSHTFMSCALFDNNFNHFKVVNNLTWDPPTVSCYFTHHLLKPLTITDYIACGCHATVSRFLCGPLRYFVFSRV